MPTIPSHHAPRRTEGSAGHDRDPDSLPMEVASEESADMPAAADQNDPLRLGRNLRNAGTICRSYSHFCCYRIYRNYKPMSRAKSGRWGLFRVMATADLCWNPTSNCFVGSSQASTCGSRNAYSVRTVSSSGEGVEASSGTSMRMRVPCPGRLSISRRKSVPYSTRRRSRTLLSPMPST